MDALFRRSRHGLRDFHAVQCNRRRIQVQNRHSLTIWVRRMRTINGRRIGCFQGSGNQSYRESVKRVLPTTKPLLSNLIYISYKINRFLKWD